MKHFMVCGFPTTSSDFLYVSLLTSDSCVVGTLDPNLGLRWGKSDTLESVQ